MVASEGGSLERTSIPPYRFSVDKVDDGRERVAGVGREIGGRFIVSIGLRYKSLSPMSASVVEKVGSHHCYSSVLNCRGCRTNKGVDTQVEKS